MDHERKTDIVTVDGALMGIWGPSGEHTLTLRYRAPGLNLGFSLAGMGLWMAIGLGWCAYGRCRNTDDNGAHSMPRSAPAQVVPVMEDVP